MGEKYKGRLTRRVAIYCNCPIYMVLLSHTRKTHLCERSMEMERRGKKRKNEEQQHPLSGQQIIKMLWIDQQEVDRVMEEIDGMRRRKRDKYLKEKYGDNIPLLARIGEAILTKELTERANDYKRRLYGYGYESWGSCDGD